MFTRIHVRIYLWVFLFLLTGITALVPLVAHAQGETQEEIMNRAIDLYFDKQYDDALKELDLAAQKSPDSPHIVGWKAWVHYAQGNWKQAVDTYDKAIALNDEYGILYLDRAMVYAQTGKTQLAIKDFEKAMKLDAMLAFTPNDLPNDIQPYAFLIRNYEHALAEQPDDFIAMTFLGNVFANIGEYEEAAEYYKQALEIAPDFASAKKNFKQAENLYQVYAGEKSYCEHPKYGFIRHMTHGQDFSGEITSEDTSYSWCFTVARGEYVWIEMERESGNLAGELYVFNAQDNPQKINDRNFLNSQHARLIWQANRPGEYYLLANRQGFDDGNTMGDFSLTFRTMNLKEVESLIDKSTDVEQLFSIGMMFEEAGSFVLAERAYTNLVFEDQYYSEAYKRLGDIAFDEYDSCEFALPFWVTYAVLEEQDIFSFLFGEGGIALLDCAYRHKELLADILFE